MATAKMPFVTIVSGLPRTGTSMMMRMLEAGGMPVLVDNLRRPDIDNPNGYYEFEPVMEVRNDASWLTQAQGKAVKMVYRLLYNLPHTYEYRVILMERKLSEVIASQVAMLERLDRRTTDTDTALLATLLATDLNKFRVWADRRPNLSIIRMDYHDVLNDPWRAANAVSAFLGQSLDHVAMAKVVDQALYRQRH